MANRARGTTKGIESAVLLPAVDAIAAMRGGDVRSLEPVRDLAQAAIASGGTDLLVTAYRSCPELLSLLLRDEDFSLDIAALIRRVGDDDLAQELGLLAPDIEDPRQRLSPREREVYGLLLQRLSNRQIAGLLVIETSTVKAHTHRIYEKLGVHSRTALAIQASLTQRGYATSATDVADTP
jgi:DNA-binding NarL/FixJ family response regulator